MNDSLLHLIMLRSRDQWKDKGVDFSHVHLVFIALSFFYVHTHLSTAPCFVVHCTKLVYRIRVWVIGRVTHKELWLPSSLVFSLGQCSVVCWLQGGCCWRILAASVQPLFQCDDKLQRNPSHSWKLGGPSLQRRAPGPSTQTTPMYSFFLFTTLPPIPSLFPSLSAFFPLPSHTASVFFFLSLLHVDTPSLSKVFSSSFEVCFHSRATLNLWNW